MTDRLRCAIYTRKSTEEGLDQAFNSLDAQREAAEAFILSQRGEGLVALPERYDDGGFGGGKLDRPALERLLADIRGGAIECVVVYKVDRLSRSLIDFARIIETFENHNVNFVSVTQQFNTTNSLGRLTLNILLSFAQFEREIIAERTRDKMSAARRKGKWIGGRPVLGYDIDSRNSRLTVNADEAFQVRAIFKLYLDYNALLPVVREIDRRGWRTKHWVTRKGVTHGGKRFTKGRLFRLLTNPIYIGKVDFKKQIYQGEHEAIVETAMWERVQQILRRNGRNGGAEVRDSFGALLKGLLRCDWCDAGLVGTYRTNDSRRDRYYVCGKAQERGWGNCETTAVSESAIKAVVTEQIRRLGSDPRIVERIVAKAEQQRRCSAADLMLERQVTLRVLAGLEADAAADLEDRIGQMESRLAEIDQELRLLESQTVDGGDLGTALEQFGLVWESLKSWEQVRIIRTLIERVTYDGKTNRVTVSFRSAAIREMCQGTGEDR
ncbi:MAG: recombinase family protein [Acidobacteria bacterium]|nr:recombinase family protein [Acidobacteriota bacterium]